MSEEHEKYCYKIQRCRSWKQFGYCQLGSSCTFAHDRLYYNQLPSVFKMLAGKKNKFGVLDGHIIEINMNYKSLK